MKRFVLLYIGLLCSILCGVFAATSTGDMPDGGWASTSLFSTTQGAPTLSTDYPFIPFYSTSYMLDGKSSSDNSVSPSLSPRGPQRVDRGDNIGGPGEPPDTPIGDMLLPLLLAAIGYGITINLKKQHHHEKI